MALIQQAAIEQILQTPPNAFDVRLVVSHVRFFQIDPKPKSPRQGLPFLHVTPNALLAFLDERFFAVRFDLFFTVDAQFFANFDFDRQTVRVPAGFAFAAETLHRFVTRKHVFDRSSQAVPGVRHAVSCRRAFEEHERRCVGTALKRFFVDIVVVPELQNLFLKLRKLGTSGWSTKWASGCSHRPMEK